VDALGLPLRVFVTAGPVADCTQVHALSVGLKADALLGDKGYGPDAIVSPALSRGLEPVIPLRRHRVVARGYDVFLYRFRHLIENAFAKIKAWRGCATRYVKRSAFFLAFLQIRYMMPWTKIS
jgi:transposase